MKAVGYTQSLPVTDRNALVDIELPQPIASDHDLLIRVKAIAVNPVDCKIRKRREPPAGEHAVIGWDAVGEVVGIGSSVTQFTVGDEVYYAGDLNRQGCNAEFQLVDERIVGHKPKTLSATEAAAIPLTAITAWELLFEHLLIKQQAPDESTESKDIILVIGAAGGVGSMLIQLAKTLTSASIVATASRPSSQAWVKALGADYVIDHSRPLKPQIDALSIGQITHVASLNSTDTYFDSYIELLPPFGKIAVIDDPQHIDIMKIKPKSLSFHIEFMFARSLFKTDDMVKQSQLLNQVATLIDSGHIKTTLGKTLGTINATNLKQAHADIESGQTIGKIVLEGF